MKKTYWFTLTLAIVSLLAGLPASAHVVGLPLASPDAANAGGPVGSPFNISNQTEDAQEPAVAYNLDREEYLVVWYNDRPGNDDIQAQRVTRGGQLVGNAFYISGGPGVNRSHPDVTYNSQRGEYLVVWEHNPGAPEIHVRPVAGQGGVTGSEVTIATTSVAAPFRPAVAYAQFSDKYLIVWHEEGAGFSSIVGQVLNSDGTTDGGNFFISQDPGGNPRYDPDVAYNRSRNEYLVVWEQQISGDYDIYAQRVQGNGTPIIPFYIIDADIADQLNPAVAAIPTEPNKGHYLVVYEDHANPGNGHIYARRVKGEGTPDGAYFEISTAPEDESDPAVAGYEHTQEYLVAWSKIPSPLATLIHAGKVPLGAAQAEEIAVPVGPNSDHAAVASGPVGDFLVVFELLPAVALNEQPNAGTWNIYGQLWGNRLHLPLIVRNFQ